MNDQTNRACPECKAAPGQLHKRGCDVEQCPYCGGQMLQCLWCAGDEYVFPDDDRLPWTGVWPGVVECQEFGWYSRLTPNGRVRVKGQSDAGASPDLNRLYTDARWDRERKRFVQKTLEELAANEEIPEEICGIPR